MPGRERAIEVVGVRAWMPSELVKSSKVLPKPAPWSSSQITLPDESVRSFPELPKPVQFRVEILSPPETERPVKVLVAVVEVAWTTPKTEVEAVTKAPADIPED